eukprot:SAG22_NODE_2067_length_3057_cov_2.417174_3_plen_71_part_00
MPSSNREFRKLHLPLYYSYYTQNYTRAPAAAVVAGEAARAMEAAVGAEKAANAAKAADAAAVEADRVSRS